ncbi:hypothetical protein VTH06DRAFT_3282 [Thermothelomyces fergusii]
MAPGAPPAVWVDLRAQIIENCEFFSKPCARLSLVIAKEPLGALRAIVVKTEGGAREALLSEAAASLTGALQALHDRSAEAVQNYISSNGFASVSAAKQWSSAFDDDDDDDEDDVEAHGNDSSTATLEESRSLSDDETASLSSVGRVKRRRRKAREPAGESSARRKATRQGRARSRSPWRPARPARSPSPSPSRSSCSSSPGYRSHYDPPAINPFQRPPIPHDFSQRMPPRPPPRPPQGTFPFLTKGHHAPPPPPPPPPPVPQPFIRATYGSTTSTMPPPPVRGPLFPGNKAPPNTANRDSSGHNDAVRTTMPPTPHASPPGHHPAVHRYRNQRRQPQPQPQQQPQPAMHDLVLHIRWRHHGERRIVQQTSQITTRGLQQSALSFVTQHGASFANGPSSPLQQQQQQQAPPGSSAGLRAAVRAVVVDGLAYDLAGWAGADLGRLLDRLLASQHGASAKPMPTFEVDVWGAGEDAARRSAPPATPGLACGMPSAAADGEATGRAPWTVAAAAAAAPPPAPPSPPPALANGLRRGYPWSSSVSVESL